MVPVVVRGTCLGLRGSGGGGRMLVVVHGGGAFWWDGGDQWHSVGSDMGEGGTSHQLLPCIVTDD